MTNLVLKRINFFNKIFFLAVFMVLLSCSKKQSEEINRHIDITKSTNASPSYYFSIESVIPLRNHNSPVLSGLEDIYRTGDVLIAHDRNRVIYLFDLDGNLISSSERIIGHGHGEYDNLLAYSYNPYNNRIEVITPTKMKIYDRDFNFIEDRNIPSHKSTSGNDGCMFTEIYDLGENIHALLPSGTSHNRNSIIIYDSSKEETLKTIDYNSDIAGLINMQTHSFTNSGDSVIFYPPGIGRYAYSLDRENFGLKNTIQIDGTNNNTDNNKYVLDSNDIMPLRFLFTKRMTLFLTKEGNTLKEMSYLISDENGENGKVMIIANDKKQFPVITSSDGKFIYGLSDGEDLGDYYSALGIECPDSLKKYSNVVLRYSIK
ncbi:MAG: 6-bladed beta-propeller [Clostridium sp.]|nr:6-bladed beta-propeller [Clostridium sp.]